MGIHDGHRDRMREKLLKNGEETLCDHELIEMLLYHSVPRKDTNPIAHELIEKFGSVSGILNADAEELQAKAGISRNSALLIKLVHALMRRSAMDESIGESIERYDTLDKLANLMIGYFVGVSVERTYLVMLDNSMRLIDVVLLGEGTINESPFPLRLLVEHAINRKASSVLIAHNHPNGLAIPSGSDIEFTHQLDQALAMIGIPLLESIVVAGRRYAPILRASKGAFRASPLGDGRDDEFYERFYSETKDT